MGQGGYYAEYYKRNKDEILRKRRAKYQEDAAYRERQQRRARTRARGLAETKRLARDMQNRLRATKLREMMIDLTALSSQQVKNWPVGTLVTSSVICMVLDISLGTLSNWVKKKILPTPTIMSTAGNFLFSVPYLDVVRAARIEALDNSLSLDKFSKLANKMYGTIQAQEESLWKGGSIDS
jgi:hypothetical protein